MSSDVNYHIIAVINPKNTSTKLREAPLFRFTIDMRSPAKVISYNWRSQNRRDQFNCSIISTFKLLHVHLKYCTSLSIAAFSFSKSFSNIELVYSYRLSDGLRSTPQYLLRDVVRILHYIYRLGMKQSTYVGKLG